MIDNEIFRHYGHSEFNKDLFVEIQNRPYFNKPFGGLWSSPTKDVDITWEKWSIDNDFSLHKLKTYFDFKLKPNARVLVVKDKKDFNNLPRYTNIKFPKWLEYDSDLALAYDSKIDFEAIAQDYDAILVYMYRSEDIAEETYLVDGMYYWLYGWDVDTLLVLNKDIIEVIEDV